MKMRVILSGRKTVHDRECSVWHGECDTISNTSCGIGTRLTRDTWIDGSKALLDGIVTTCKTCIKTTAARRRDAAEVRAKIDKILADNKQ